MCTEAAAAGQAGASPDQAVRAAHPHTPQAPPQPLIPCCPCQTLLPRGQEGQEASCHTAGHTHACLHSCIHPPSTCLSLGSALFPQGQVSSGLPVNMQLHACEPACLGFPVMHALQHEARACKCTRQPTRHGCTDMLHRHGTPGPLDNTHMAKHDRCQPTRAHSTSLTEGHLSDPSQVASSVSIGVKLCLHCCCVFCTGHPEFALPWTSQWL